MTDGPADAALLARVSRGDEAAFAALVARYQDRFYTVARRMLGNALDAEDAVQHAFLRIFQKAHTYEARWQVSTWLYRVLTNVCVDAWRKRRREARALDGWDREATSPAEPARHAEDGRLEPALARLPVEARTILILRYVDDLSYQEIARIRGITPNTVKSQLRRGKGLLRRRLKGGPR